MHILNEQYLTFSSWQTNIIGLKTIRLDYSDQLRQPQAEVELETLLSFLLDLGAVPDAIGWRMLRASGLWVPVGTPLLVSPDRSEPVLTIASLDDSDGNLSLAVRWSSSWGMRDHTSLPPYWVLVKGTLPERPSSSKQPELNPFQNNNTEVLEREPSEKRKSAKSRYTPSPEEKPPAIRCQIGIEGIVDAVPDDFDPQLFDSLDIAHLRADAERPNSKGTWFASAITALGTSSQTILWNYKIPSDILSFAKKDTIPCGVLVLLAIVDESETPEWATKYNDEQEKGDAVMRKLQEQTRSMMRESSMNPADRAKAARERTAKVHDDWVDEMRASRRQEAQRAETRVVEAMQSPKWGNKLVAEHNLAWLKKEGHVDAEHDLKRVVEVLLWRMVNEPELAEEMASMLDSWKAFVDNGGMRRAEYLELKEKQVVFAQASLVLAVIEHSVTAAHGSLAMDLQECVRIWKKVRLG